MKEIKLKSWTDFEAALRTETKRSPLLVRNFARVTFDNVCTDDAVEVDNLEVVRRTGTDRRETSSMWNAPGFDFDHDLEPSGKRPNDIIYAFLVDLRAKPYLVSAADDDQGNFSFQALDLTEGLTEHDALIVYAYGSENFDRVATNEYWFRCDPLEAALFLFTLTDEEDEETAAS
ncbi:hypothetical protein SAMN03159423_1932 [Bradyrhizobium sp. NFR13]|uniref:hypothetical protein n=1 Tax=Bradyrhizobium sp. NFR13 TaxID=1566285 RepID=UPI0008E07897|nr:hypothetical protein [Bradyrhizobium sp. NFR13]SFL42365.1 hypothetical protein SAMN03159423_1932 [Bradyrhizobium sp. NFR13]